MPYYSGYVALLKFSPIMLNIVLTLFALWLTIMYCMTMWIKLKLFYNNESFAIVQIKFVQDVRLLY